MESRVPEFDDWGVNSLVGYGDETIYARKFGVNPIK